MRRDFINPKRDSNVGKACFIYFVTFLRITKDRPNHSSTTNSPIYRSLSIDKSLPTWMSVIRNFLNIIRSTDFDRVDFSSIYTWHERYVHQISHLIRWNTLCRLTSGTVVSYGVLMNFGALSFISDTRTITGMVRFLFVCFTVQLNCKENENHLILNYCIHTSYVFACKYSDINISTKTVAPWLNVHDFPNLLPTTLDTEWWFR